MHAVARAALLAAPLNVRRHALRLLLEARDTAAELAQPAQNFACPLAGLYAQGVTDAALRWLCLHGFVKHLRETTRPTGNGRTFAAAANLRFRPTSCFLLTTAGLNHARKALASHSHAPSGPHAVAPVWDAFRRELRLGDTLVKRFRQPARNQEKILAAFQEEGWPPRIDDPLSGDNGSDARARLHACIHRLNDQPQARLRFECDGTGEGILWRPARASRQR